MALHLVNGTGSLLLIVINKLEVPFIKSLILFLIILIQSIKLATQQTLLSNINVA